MKNTAIIALLLLWQHSFSQSTSQLLEQIEHFNSFATVLYMAAHPDDENTRVISWLSNGEHAKTGYLSLTRGDGGQNLIGTEFGDELGILRTNELLAARKIDGGEQFFTRAVDFGYSRSATESFTKWEEQQVLADVVWVIRKFKPQIIITRFPPDERAGHGHHTASALLAIKGAQAAADPSQFPEQLREVSVWQVQSVYWNTSTWWDKTVSAEMDTNETIWRADIGGYDPILGMSYNELGSLARSQHKCQGFGVDIQRGETFEYFRHLWGKPLPNGLQDLVHPNWNKLGIAEMANEISALRNELNPQFPEQSLPLLADMYAELDNITDPYWRARKKHELEKIILACGGFFAEALAEKYAYLPGEKAKVTVNLLSRTSDEFYIDNLQAPGGGMVFKTAFNLPKNKFSSFDLAVDLPTEVSNPYWLASPHADLFAVQNPTKDLGRAINSPLAEVETMLHYGEIAIPLKIPVRYKWRDRVEGELQRDVVVVPPFCVNFSAPVAISRNGASVEMAATIHHFQDSGSFMVHFNAQGWLVEVLGQTTKGSTYGFSAKGLDKHEQIKLRLTPQKGVTQSVLLATDGAGQKVRSYREIAYAHVQPQVFMPAAEATLTNLSIKILGKRVAYIPGAGDDVAAAIAQMGYAVDVLDQEKLAKADLSVYQAVVVGIRGYNTQTWLPNYAKKLEVYMQNGGNVIVQYNTASRFLDDKPLIPAPFTFEIGSGRVTEENSPVAFLVPNHPTLNAPNKLSQTDFEGWVQERGLYFASAWDEHFVAPIGWADEGQKQEQGGLIIAEVGKGAFIYTGISFFRLTPAGVPGAYRLLANLISYEKK